MVDPTLVLLAIEAAIKLGQKTYDVLMDSTEAAPLLLPLGGLAGSIQEAEAIEFFDRPENRSLVAAGGPYQGFQGQQLVTALGTVRQLGEHLGGGQPSAAEAVEVIQALHKFEQHKQGFGPRSPWQRIAGTALEIGIDFFLANPQAVGKDSAARRVMTSFLTGIQDIPFAEGDPVQVVGDTLAAALGVLGDNAALVTRDARIQVVLGGVVSSLRADLLAARTSLGEVQRREELLKRITASVLRGGAGAIAANAQLFVRGQDKAKALLRDTLTEVLEGVRDQENLFSNDSLERLFRTALAAAADHAALFSDKRIVQAVLGKTLATMTAAPGPVLFSAGSLAAIVQAALEAVAENADSLIDPADPGRQLLADVLEAMAYGLASDLAGTGSVKDLLSTTQVVHLAQALFREVATHPERLLGGPAGDPRRTALAQVLGSVARALGEDPRQLASGATLVQLVLSILPVVLGNCDTLLDLASDNPTTNLVYQVLSAAAQGVLGGSDKRRLVDREVFVDLGTRVLRVVSANAQAPLGPKAALVTKATVAALALSTDALRGQINGENLPGVVAGLLRAALRGKVDLEDKRATRAAAAALLQAA